MWVGGVARCWNYPSAYDDDVRMCVERFRSNGVDADNAPLTHDLRVSRDGVHWDAAHQEHVIAMWRAKIYEVLAPDVHPPPLFSGSSGPPAAQRGPVAATPMASGAHMPSAGAPQT